MPLKDFFLALFKQFNPSFKLEEVDFDTLELTINGLQFYLTTGELWLLTF
jgi:hypothetical protein